MQTRIYFFGLVLLLLFAAGSSGQTPTSVILAGNPRPVPQVGFNLNSGTKPSWYNPAFLDSSRRLGFGALRYPGGTESQFFDWQTGNSSLNASPSRQPLAEYIYGLENLPAEGVFCLNMFTENREDQLLMLQTAAAAGVEIAYIELGNELWDTNEELNYASRYLTASDYADTAAAWIPYLKTFFPNARYALLSAPETPTTPSGGATEERIVTWNDGIAGQLDAADAVTFHYYFPLTGVNPANPDLTQVLSKPFELWPIYRQYSLAELPPGKPVWVTEYNLNDGDRDDFIIGGSWSHALYTGTLLFQMLAEPQIEVLLCHQLFGPPTWGCYDAFFTTPPDTSSLNPTPQHALMGLLHRAITASTQAEQLVFSENPNQSFGETNFPALTGWVFTGGDSTYVALLNLSSTAFAVDISELTTNNYTAHTLTYIDPLETGVLAGDLDQGLILEATGAVTVPAYGLVVVSVPDVVNSLEPSVSGGSELKVWPNPASGMVSLSLGYPAREVWVVLYDLQGRRLGKWMLTPLNDTVWGFSAEGLAPGSYAMQVMADGQPAGWCRFLRK